MCECGFETSKALMSTSQKEFLVLLVQWSKSSTNVWRRQSNKTLMTNFENAPNGLPKFFLFDQCPEKSSLNVNHVFPVCPPSDPSVVFLSKDSCKMTHLKSINGCICCLFKEGGCTQASQRLSDPIRPPTCLCKKVGGYLTRCACIAASIAQIDNHQSLSPICR